MSTSDQPADTRAADLAREIFEYFTAGALNFGKPVDWPLFGVYPEKVKERVAAALADTERNTHTAGFREGIEAARAAISARANELRELRRTTMDRLAAGELDEIETKIVALQPPGEPAMTRTEALEAVAEAARKLSKLEHWSPTLADILRGALSRLDALPDPAERGDLADVPGHIRYAMVNAMAAEAVSEMLAAERGERDGDGDND